MNADEVRRIQTRLRELGLYQSSIDGDEGPLTRQAVRAFQRTVGLRPDGVAGPLTMAELFPAPIPGRDDDDEQATAGIKAVWPRQPEVLRYYGDVGENQVLLDLPYPMWLAWDLRRKVTRINLHEKVAASAGRVLFRVLDHYGPARIDALDLDVFGGSLNVRKMRGGSRWSMHAWGIAIDFDPALNQLRWDHSKARMAGADYTKFWKLWEDEGWVSLGRSKDFDWMHVQAARL